jgi:hypothetical protein
MLINNLRSSVIGRRKIIRFNGGEEDKSKDSNSGKGDSDKDLKVGRRIIVSLPQEWFQEIKCMMILHSMHGLFLTCIQEPV